MADNEVDLNHLTPEQDMMIFEQAVKNNDFEHALFHLACALSSEPMNKAWLQQLDLLILSQPNLSTYIDLSNEQYYATVALQGYILYKNGDVNHGIDLLGSVLKEIPQAPYLVWVDEWIKELI